MPDSPLARSCRFVPATVLALGLAAGLLAVAPLAAADGSGPSNACPADLLGYDNDGCAMPDGTHCYVYYLVLGCDTTPPQPEK